jgi:hypothetical protein
VQDRLFDTRALANASGEVTILDGLRFRTTVGTDLSFRGRDTYYPRTTLQGAAQGGRAIRARVDNTSFLNENTLTYDRSFGDAHRVSTVVGYTRQSLNSVRGDTRNSNFVSDITGFESIGAGSQAGGPNVGLGAHALDARLVPRPRELLAARPLPVHGHGAPRRLVALRRQQPVGLLPRRGRGLARERGVVPPRRARSSATSSCATRSASPATRRSHPTSRSTACCRSSTPSAGSSPRGYQPSAIGNPELSWETTRQSDLGLDLGLFNGRVDFTGDYYVKKTNDLLLQIFLPSEVGYSGAFVNAGSVENKGFEVGLTLRVLEAGAGGRRLGWSTTFNYARNRNRVLDLGGTTRIFARSSTISDLQSGTNSSSSVVEVGRPIGAFFGYRTAGLFRDTVTLNAWKRGTRLESGTPTLGNVQYVDVDGNGVINALDRTIIGDPNPDFTLGWQNTVSFRGFEVSGLLDGSYGNQILNLNNIRLGGASPSTNVLRERVVDAWTPENPGGRWQRIGASFGQQGTDITSEVLEDGSYLRLRTVTLSRALPTGWLRGRGGFEARAYVTGQNLVTWSKYSGFNPDVSSLGVGNLNRGVDVGSYPLARTFTFGLNLNY